MVNPNYPTPHTAKLPPAPRWMIETSLFWLNQNQQVFPVKLYDMSVSRLPSSSLGVTVLIHYPQFLWGRGTAQVSDIITETRYHFAGPKTLSLCYERTIP